MIDFTLYPNMGGNLGEKKVAIPDGVTTFWPDGDALVGNFIYKDGKLSGFVDTKALIANDNKTTTIPYDYFKAEMENVREDSVKFNLSDRCKYFTLKLMPKYKGCKTLSDIVKIEPNYKTVDIVDGIWSKGMDDLEGGDSMFYECGSLTTFTSDLSSLINGVYMFRNCSNLTTFKCNDLCALKFGGAMFSGCSNLKIFDCPDMGSLTYGNGMFDNCRNLTTFDSDLKSLTDGTKMFNLCWALTSFKSNLNSLIDGTSMFTYCKLDAPSIKNIIDTINTVESAPLGIGMGCNNNITDVNLFAQEVGYPDMTTLLQTLQDKGWTVTAQYNGRPTSNYSLRQPESLPIYVKLVEVVLPVNEEEITPIYEYTSSDETKFYNLDWFHETTGSTDGYTQFNSFQEAISTLNIKQIEK